MPAVAQVLGDGRQQVGTGVGGQRLHPRLRAGVEVRPGVAQLPGRGAGQRLAQRRKIRRQLGQRERGGEYRTQAPRDLPGPGLRFLRRGGRGLAQLGFVQQQVEHRIIREAQLAACRGVRHRRQRGARRQRAEGLDCGAGLGLVAHGQRQDPDPGGQLVHASLLGNQPGGFRLPVQQQLGGGSAQGLIRADHQLTLAGAQREQHAHGHDDLPVGLGQRASRAHPQEAVDPGPGQDRIQHHGLAVDAEGGRRGHAGARETLRLLTQQGHEALRGSGVNGGRLRVVREEHGPAAQRLRQPAHHRVDGIGTDRGTRQRGLGTQGAHQVHRVVPGREPPIGTRNALEGRAVRNDAQFHSGLPAGVDHVLRNRVQPRAETQAQRLDVLVLQPLHVGQRGGGRMAEGHAGGQQQFAALQIGGGILQLGNVHAGDRGGAEGGRIGGEKLVSEL
ncbi:hypothetical protein AFL94_02770 [Arthrobacter sp. LS16]|nr:hypothetical protein AFL94_02770 [Arthrobacter sp. LS16]